MEKVERREMKTERLNIKETLSDWKRIQLVITSTSFYRRIWRLVYTCDANANANANANGNASESTRPKQTRGKRDTQAQWKHFYKMADNDWAFTDSHVWVGNTNGSSRKWKLDYYLRWRLRLHLHLRWVGSHEQLFLSFAFAFAFLCDWLTERGVGTNPTTLLGS